MSSLYLRPTAWLTVTQTEYLQSFIRDGGAAVKFIVPTEDLDHDELRQGLRSLAEAEGYVFAWIDAAKTRVYLIDHLFHEIARQVDWDGLAFSFLSRILVKNGFTLSPQPEEFTLAKLAELNGRDERLLRQELHALPEKHLIRNYQMGQGFRIAMIRLC